MTYNRFFVGVTDKDWFLRLRASNCDEVNFWSPGATTFKALSENELFLFKLHKPDNYIVGGGFFVRYSILPAARMTEENVSGFPAAMISAIAEAVLV